MRFSAGEAFGRYVIEELVGEGGMGEVYRARDTRLGRKVALKVLRAEGASDSDTVGRAVARMQREARAVAALSHPSIVAVFDVGEHDATPYIAMELAQGKPLRALIGEDAPPLPVRLGILLDVAKALSAAHQAGLVHRDVKPENVTVRHDFSVKVLDFGIARLAPQAAELDAPMVDGALAMTTAEGAFLGTPAYMAPEQIRGEAIDGRADQFAWGVLAFEVLSGKLPFRTDKGAISLIASIMSDPPAPLVGVPEGVADIVRRALEKAPEDRFPSMDDVVAALSSEVSGEAPSKMSTTQREKAAVATVDAAAPTSRMGRPLRLVLWPALLAALSVLVWVVFKNEFPQEPAPALIASARASPRPVATAITDLPVPVSESAEAKLAFREGLQAVRDAMWDTAALAFDRARKADPGMAAAHMRFAMLGMWLDFSAAQEAFRKALLLRSSLSERDQLFLDAFAPVIQSAPSDYAAAQRKFEALSARFPGDAEIVFWSLRALARGGPDQEVLLRALALADQCVGLDPKYADCWQTKEIVLYLLERHDEALASLDKCLEVSPGASDCLQDKIRIDARLGHCPAVAETARRWMAREPSNPKPYIELAGSLYHTGEPEAAVRMALEQAAKRHQALGQGFAAQLIKVWTDAAFGDFEAALAAADRLESDQATPQPLAQISLLWLRTSLRIEMGRFEEAGRLADDFFARSAMRPALPERDHGEADPTVFLRAVAVRAGKSTPAAFEASRAAWIGRQSQSTLVERIFVWRDAYALPILAAAPAAVALEKEAEFAPLPAKGPFGLLPEIAALHGIVRSRAGKPAEARPLLERGALLCNEIGDVIHNNQVIAELGAVREAVGDRKGACEAYRGLVSRWGKAKESVTAKEARKRMKALSCDSGPELGL